MRSIAVKFTCERIQRIVSPKTYRQHIFRQNINKNCKKKQKILNKEQNYKFLNLTFTFPAKTN